MFWVSSPSILLDREQLLALWPTPDMTFDEKMNAVSRLVILISVVGFMATVRVRFLVAGAATLAAIAMYGMKPRKEGFAQVNVKDYTAPTKKNPLMNVLLPELNGNPNRKPAMSSYTPQATELIKAKVKEMDVDQRIFQGTNNEIALEYSMRNFYTTASSTIPNDQEGFGKFCYGDMISAKEGNPFALLRGTSRLQSVVG